MFKKLLCKLKVHSIPLQFYGRSGDFHIARCRWCDAAGLVCAKGKFLVWGKPKGE